MRIVAAPSQRGSQLQLVDQCLERWLHLVLQQDAGEAQPPVGVEVPLDAGALQWSMNLKPIGSEPEWLHVYLIARGVILLAPSGRWAANILKVHVAEAGQCLCI